MTELSPAARAVLDAYIYEVCDTPSRFGIAAALRAAVATVRPRIDGVPWIRDVDILAIAEELERRE